MHSHTAAIAPGSFRGLDLELALDTTWHEKVHGGHEAPRNVTRLDSTFHYIAWKLVDSESLVVEP